MLIVEDEPLVAILIEDFVKELGCRFFHIAGSTAAALERWKTLSPDIVILDVTLIGSEPDFIVADHLATMGIPFIFSSGHHPDVVPPHHCHRPFLTKPFGMDDITVAIVDCLATPNPPGFTKYPISVITGPVAWQMTSRIRHIPTA